MSVVDPASHDHDAVARYVLITRGPPEVLPLDLLGQFALVGGSTRSATISTASSWSVGETWL